MLALLVLVAAYIWTKNLSFFHSDNSSVHVEQTDSLASAPTPKPTVIVYRPAKVNPFRRISTPDHTIAPKQKLSPKVLPVPEKPSSHLILSGIVGRPPLSQAVFQDRTGVTTIRGLNDSLGVWKLVQISFDRAVFSSGRYRDTLLLIK